MKQIATFFLLVSFTLAFQACSSSDSDNPSGPTTQTGVFKDSNVAGLTYVSGEQSGVTDESGEFTYEVGQTVTFSIGGVTIGTASGDSIITPIDLVESGSAASTQVQNIVKFLMMLDDDGNPDNGIRISSAVQSAAAIWPEIDFATYDLDTELNYILPAVSAIDGFSHVLPDADTARSHLESSLRCTYAGAYQGTYSGNDSGNFGIMVDALTGVVSGLVHSTPRNIMMTLSGSSPIGYNQTPSFVSGLLSDGSTFQGQLNDPDSISGTWRNTTDQTSGTFSGTRIGGASNADYRFTGQFQGDDYGVIAFDISDVNMISGIAYSLSEDEQYSITGTLTGDSLNARLANGATASGTLNVATGQMSGTWQGPDGTSGSFNGCGCKLN